ncbi:STOREKEEPER protein-like, partial [Ananas comosus]|uniref:STOREKEEPER protein-like n=1 Tax=Ananas comosus TaxID=4615 RepID=A0A6P5H9A9_ANACO
PEEDDEEPPPAQRPSRGVDPSIKPISSRPMDASPKPKKPSSSPSEPPSKKPKSSSSDAPPSEQKRQLFQRLWGPDDEIAVLRGLAEYRSKKGSLPSSSQDVDALRGHIRGALQLEVTNQQLSDKIRRLKKKFATNSARGRSGADPKFTKDHERAAFEMSKKIWGAASKSSPSANAAADADTDEEKSEESDDEAGSEQNAKEENNNNRTRLAAVASVANGKAEHERGKFPLPYLKEAVDELAKEHPCGAAFKRAFEFLDEPKAKGMEEKLKKLRMEEIKQHLRRMDLMKETVKMMLEALAKSD